MIENYAVLVAGLVIVGGVFPFPTFVSTCIFAAGRVMHQIGYTKGYGSHAIGFLLHMIGCQSIEGMALMVALKGFGVL